MDARLEQTRRATATHCWFHGFRQFMTPLLARIAGGRTDLRIIDCGCGVGQNLSLLAPYGRPIGLELEAGGAVASRAGGYPIIRGDTRHLPFAADSFDVAVSFDVLQCVDADVAAVREMARVVRPGGTVVLAVAALEVLRGDHAEIWHEYRRYTPAAARALAQSAGLHVERVAFAFAALFPLLLVARTAQRVMRPFRPPSNADMDVPWGPLNSALRLLLDGEAVLSRYVPMPVGSSIFVVARKPGPT